MKILFGILFALNSSLTLAATEPTMVCKFPKNRELKVYGPLGYLYEDDVEQNSEVSFPNTVDIIIDNKVVFKLPNSTSMVNDRNIYTVTSYLLNPKDLTLRKVINLFYKSEEGRVAHIDINLPDFRFRGKGSCSLIR